MHVIIVRINNRPSLLLRICDACPRNAFARAVAMHDPFQHVPDREQQRINRLESQLARDNSL